MEELLQYAFLLKNFVVWAILGIAFAAYALLLDLSFFKKRCGAWYESTLSWIPSLKKMLASLPLLGLLGTITGLMDTFLSISRDKGLVVEELITGGIAAAMLTTQLGLVLVIPGFLLLAYLYSRIKKWELDCAHEV